MSLHVNFCRFQQHCLILKTKKFFQLRQRFGYPTPLTIFENRHKCANQSDCLLWNLFLECYCSETMRARRMVVKSFFRALFCPITFAVLVRWHLSFFQCNPWPYTATLCELAHICTYICDPLRILGHIIADLRASMCISVLHNKTELNRSASTKTAAARNERKNQAEINQLLQVQSTNHLVARFRVVNIYSRASFLVVPLFK